MSLHHVDAAQGGKDFCIVVTLLLTVCVIVGITFLCRLPCPSVVVLANVYLHQSLAGEGRHQRVLRLLSLLDGFQVVALCLLCIAYRQEEFADVMIEDGLALQPSVFLEDRQCLLVVGNGEL